MENIVKKFFLEVIEQSWADLDDASLSKTYNSDACDDSFNLRHIVIYSNDWKDYCENVDKKVQEFEASSNFHQSIRPHQKCVV